MELDYLNYKLPLKEVTDGYGYYGTLAQSKDHEEVQCHICGRMVINLGQHAWQSHEMKARDYRVKFQLGLRTPLCSDTFSEKCKQVKIDAWNKLNEDEKLERLALMAQARSQTKRIGNPRSLEAMNKDGMCPDQLIEKIQILAKKIGVSPTFEQFKTEYNGKYTGSIIRTFGSWNGAKHIANLPSNKSGADTPHNRSPYSDEVLLEYLRSFQKEKGHTPTHSDWRKGFLPSYNLYRHRFGGIQKARELAGV